MLTFGLFPGCFTTINKRWDEHNKGCFDGHAGQDVLRLAAGMQSGAWMQSELLAWTSSLPVFSSWASWLFLCVSCFVVNLIQLHLRTPVGTLELWYEEGVSEQRLNTTEDSGSSGGGAPQGCVGGGSRVGGRLQARVRGATREMCWSFLRASVGSCFLWKEREENSKSCAALGGWRENEPWPQAASVTVTGSVQDVPGSTSCFSAFSPVYLSHHLREQSRKS